MTSVSVVIPCFNLGTTIEAAIDSALAQTREVETIVVVDDGSTDAPTRQTLAGLNRPRTRVIATENRGLGPARNLGIIATTTPYVVTLDADDVLDPRYVEMTAGVLDASPDIDFVSCAMRAFEGADYIWKPDGSLVGGLVRGSYHATTLMRRQIFDALGGFDPRMVAFETGDFFMVALECGHRGVILDEPLLNYRVRRNSKYHSAIGPERFLAARRVLLEKHADTVANHAAEMIVESDVFLAELQQHQRHLRGRLASREPEDSSSRVALTTNGSANWQSASQAGDAAAILLYHRIGRVPSDVRGLAISPELFELHARYLQDNCTLMPLVDLVAAALERRLPPRAVALTFDDGYLDALTTVAPILRRRGAPATFFVNSDGLENGDESWGDTLERIFLELTPPPLLNLEIGGQRLALPTTTPIEREAARQRLAELMYPAGVVERAQILRMVKDWCGQDLRARDSHRRMTSSELRMLGAMEGCAIGAHTVHHLRLTAHTSEVQLQEMLEDRRRVHTALGRVVDAFAYPYGIYDDTTVRAAVRAGFRSAVTVDPRMVRHDTSPMRLPRFEPPLGDLDSFTQFVESLFEPSTADCRR